MRFVLLAIALGLVSITTRAHAQSERDEALGVFEQAVSAYREGAFRRAATLFAAAYELHPEPVLLFNWARSLEQSDQDDDAMDAYRQYLELGTSAPDYEEAQRRLNALQREHATGEVASNEGELAWWARGEPEQDEAEPEPVDVRDPLIVTSGGAVLAAVGLGVGVGARRDNDLAADPRTTHERAVELVDQAQRRQRTANVLLVVGGAALLGGLVWTLVRIKSARGAEERETEVALVGTQLSVLHRF